MRAAVSVGIVVFHPEAAKWELHLRRGRGSDSWTVRRLFCRSASVPSKRAFSLEEVSLIRSDMELYWPSRPGDERTNEEFWSDAWGSRCGLADYFQRGLQLRADYQRMCEGAGSDCVVYFASIRDRRDPPVAAASYRLTLDKCRGSDAWTVHGLWLRPATSVYCSGQLFDRREILPIRSKLESRWRACPGDGKWGNDELWLHQWDKHGTCTGMSIADYFSKGMELLSLHQGACTGTSCCIELTTAFEFSGVQC